MTWVRFFFKLLVALLGPALLAFALSTVWSVLYPYPTTVCDENGKCYTLFSSGLSLAEQCFGVLIFGLLLLSIVLPVLLTIREIQKESSIEELHPLATTVTAPTDKLWK